MSDNRVAGFGKDPLAPSHGESLVDQSFQSLKSKEIRDSMSPTEMRFQSMALNNPNTTGWNVQSSSEVSPDGRGFRAETVATTDGVENINGGTAEFKGRNEQRSSAMHEGDDKNFMKKASESSNTHLQEKVVVGDENSGRTEVRTSSTTSTSSSQVFQSSSTTDYDNDQPQYLMDSRGAPQRVTEPQYQQVPSQYQPQQPHDVRRSADPSSTTQQFDRQTEQYRQNRQETNTAQNVQTNETHEQNRRYVDMDKASPEYQRQVQYLMSQPGEIISNTVEYPKPNVKMITTVKRLPDGTIVRNKRYETEETGANAAPSPTTNNTRQTSSNLSNQRSEPQTSQQPKNYREPSGPHRRPNDNVVDNMESNRYIQDTHSNDVSNVETKFSTVKTSNRKFSTETTSETIQEYDDRNGPTSPGTRGKPVANDFSTHGFPSVRPNKPTQEFATDRPQGVRPNQSYTPQNLESPRDAVVPAHGQPNQNITERRIPTEDGEVIIVSSEKRHNVKQQSNSERIIETDIRTTDDNRYQQISDVSTKTHDDFSTHGFPSANQPQLQRNVYPDNRQMRPVLSGPQTTVVPSDSYTPGVNDVVTVSSQKSHTSKHSTNKERIIEHEIITEDGHPRSPAGRSTPGAVTQGHPRAAAGIVTQPGTQVYPRAPAGIVTQPSAQGYPRSPADTITGPGAEGYPHPPVGNHAMTTPRVHYTPDVVGKSPNQDFSTHGFPSVRSPTKTNPDYSTHGFPSARSPTRDTPEYASPRDGNKPRGSTERPLTSPTKNITSPPSNKKSSTTIETTERVIQKEKEVDAAHRAFAASLRSSSPVDSIRRDSFSTDGPRHTPRSSVSSTRTFRRDMREGSHDSAGGSETSRVSTNTVTRQTPPRTVGGRTVVTKQTVVTSKTGDDALHVTSPRGTKSPSPGKSVTTTTTTRTVTSKAVPKDVPKPDNIQNITTITNDTIFPINHDPLTITKTNFSDNKSNNLPSPEVVEEPCIKKHMYLLYPSAPPNTVKKHGKTRSIQSFKPSNVHIYT